jgi:hypothetical protein
MRTCVSILVRFAALGVACALGVNACGGETTTLGAPGGSGTTVTGTVGGTSLSVASQLAAIGPQSTSCSGFSGDGGGQTCTSNGQAVIVVLTNRSDATCAAAQAEATSGGSFEFANFAELLLLVSTATGTVAPGTYSIVSPSSTVLSGAAAIFGTTNATCGTVIDSNATSGSITLTQVSATDVSGTYDVSFGSEGSFSGAFDVAICDVPDAGTGGSRGGGPTVCK